MNGRTCISSRMDFGLARYRKNWDISFLILKAGYIFRGTIASPLGNEVYRPIGFGRWIRQPGCRAFVGRAVFFSYAHAYLRRKFLGDPRVWFGEECEFPGTPFYAQLLCAAGAPDFEFIESTFGRWSLCVMSHPN